MATATQELLEQSRTSLITYATTLSRGEFQSPAHIRYLAEQFEQLERGEETREIWNLPPRHGKTELSLYAIAWYLGRHPDRNAVYVTYGAELSEDSGRRIRNLVSDPLHQAIFPNSRLSGDSSAVGKFALTAGGNFYATGAGGVLTGRGGHLIVCDDLIKDTKEMRSAAQRQALWQWYQSVLRPRYEPNAAIVVISTRWGTEDFVGMLLAHPRLDWTAAGEVWRLISLPAICEASNLLEADDQRDVIGRREGDPLWAERFGLAALNATRTEIGSRAWASLYQQRPVPEEGAVFKRQWWLSYTEQPTQYSQLIFSLDTAFKAKETNDYSVLQIWAAAKSPRGPKPDFYLLHSWRARVEFPALLATVTSFAKQWRPHRIIIEDAASGQSLIQSLRSATHLPIHARKAWGDKVSRAHAVSPLVEAGRVFLPAAAGWLADLQEELESFPAGAHDDQIDAMTQALSYLDDTSMVSSEDLRSAVEFNAQAAARPRYGAFDVGHAPDHMYMNVRDADEALEREERGGGFAAYGRKRWWGF